jgi:hypothetical protein
LVRPDTSPDDLPGMLVSKAIVTDVGGETCHAALVARDNGIPAVVGVGDLPVFEPETYLSVDATGGRIFRGQLPLENGQRTKEVNLLLKWVAMMEPKPSLDFGLLEQRFCMNTVLNDFCMLEKMARLTQGSSMEQEVAELWRKLRNDSAVLMGTYLALVVGRELRHISKVRSYAMEVLQHGNAVDDLIVVLSEYYDEVQAMGHTADALPLMDIKQQIRFAQLAVKLFDLPAWGETTAYGGKKWAEIARALLAYLDGSWKFATFVDHAFDLQHNRGVLFNKHAMVHDLTNETTLQLQLSAKKNLSDIRQLRDRLINPSDWSLVTTIFSPEVDDLWEKGETLGLW